MHALPVNRLIWWRKLSDIESSQMVGGGEEQREAIRPEFNLSIMADFQRAESTPHSGFLLREHAPFRPILTLGIFRVLRSE
jgi:hypothetical protein